MTQFIFEMHSGVRWIVVLFGLLLMFRSLYGWLTKGKSSPMDRQLSLGFMIAYSLQFVLGVLVLIMLGTYERYQFEHLSVMLIAIGVAGLLGRWRRQPDPLRFRNTFLTMVVFSVFLGRLGRQVRSDVLARLCR